MLPNTKCSIAVGENLTQSVKLRIDFLADDDDDDDKDSDVVGGYLAPGQTVITFLASSASLLGEVPCAL